MYLADAAARGDLQMVRQLLESGADPNETNGQGRTAIQVMQMGNVEIANFLLENGADPNRPDPDTGTCPAHDAVREGFMDTLCLLLKWGSSLYEPTDNYGMRPIDLATDNVILGLQNLGLLKNTRQ